MTSRLIMPERRRAQQPSGARKEACNNPLQPNRLESDGQFRVRTFAITPNDLALAELAVSHSEAAEPAIRIEVGGLVIRAIDVRSFVPVPRGGHLSAIWRYLRGRGKLERRLVLCSKELRWDIAEKAGRGIELELPEQRTALGEG